MLKNLYTIQYHTILQQLQLLLLQQLQLGQPMHFTRRTFLSNLIKIRLEMTELWSFLNRSSQQEQEGNIRSGMHNTVVTTTSKLMLCSTGLGNSCFPTRIPESEVGVLAEFRVSHLEIRLRTSMERYFLVGIRVSEPNGTQHKIDLRRRNPSVYVRMHNDILTLVRGLGLNYC